MNIKLCSSRWGELNLGNISPNPANILILPKADKKYASSAKGDYRFMFQEISGEAFKVRFTLCWSKQKDTYTITTEPGISLHFGYLLSHHFYHPHLGKLTFHQNSYNFLYLSHAASEFTMEADEKFVYMDVILNTDILEHYKDDHPSLLEFIGSVKKMVPSKLQITNIVAPIEVLRWADEIIQYATDGMEDKFAFDLLVQQLVEDSLTTIRPNSGKRGSKLRQAEVDRLYFISDLLKENPNEFTIKELAAMVELTPNKLDNGFREIFGHSVLHHRKEEKMRLALRLVNDRRYNNKEVASILGYKEPQSFTRAFKKRFGYTPYRGGGKNAPES